MLKETQQTNKTLSFKTSNVMNEMIAIAVGTFLLANKHHMIYTTSSKQHKTDIFIHMRFRREEKFVSIKTSDCLFIYNFDSLLKILKIISNFKRNVMNDVNFGPTQRC